MAETVGELVKLIDILAPYIFALLMVIIGNWQTRKNNEIMLAKKTDIENTKLRREEMISLFIEIGEIKRDCATKLVKNVKNFFGDLGKLDDKKRDLKLVRRKLSLYLDEEIMKETDKKMKELSDNINKIKKKLLVIRDKEDDSTKNELYIKQYDNLTKCFEILIGIGSRMEKELSNRI